jgi:hypothetical protein
MAENDAGSAFDRDFGYLMPFLDKVRAAGEALPSGPREEIATLLAGERERWTRIRELLAGGSSSQATPQTRAPAPAAGPPGYTVGTLRRRD